VTRLCDMVALPLSGRLNIYMYVYVCVYICTYADYWWFVTRLRDMAVLHLFGVCA